MFTDRIKLIIFSLLLMPGFVQAQWMDLGSGVPTEERRFFSLSAPNEETIWALPIHTQNESSGELAKSVDGGSTWNYFFLTNDTMGAYFPRQVLAIDASTAWVLMNSAPIQKNSLILKTTNGGSSWLPIIADYIQDGYAITALHFFDSEEGLAFGSPGEGTTADSIRIYKTTDGGAHWTLKEGASLPNPADGVWVYSGNHSYAAVGDSLWFGTRSGRVFRTVNRGESWEGFETGISGSGYFPGVSAVGFEDANHGLAVTYIPTRAAITDDGGVTWTEVDVPDWVTGGSVESIPGMEGTYLITGGYQNSSKMLLTKDRGSSWVQVDYSRPVLCTEFLSPTVGFGGSVVDLDAGQGILKWTGDWNNPLAINDIEESPIRLYPNPVENLLTIDLGEFGEGDYSVEIRSVLGQLCGFYSSRSLRKMEIETKDLVSGFYYLVVYGESHRKVGAVSFVKEER